MICHTSTKQTTNTGKKTKIAQKRFPGKLNIKMFIMKKNFALFFKAQQKHPLLWYCEMKKKQIWKTGKYAKITWHHANIYKGSLYQEQRPFEENKTSLKSKIQFTGQLMWLVYRETKIRANRT